MKLAYITAALLGLAYANPVVKAPEENNLDLLDVRDENDVALFDERDEDFNLFDSLDEFFSEFEEREAELDLDEDIAEETSEIEARGAGSVLSVLHKVRNDISSVNKALEKFSKKGGPSQGQALNVQKAALRLAADVKSATKKTKASKKFSKKASGKLFHFIKHSIEPATLNSLHNFREHAPGFKKKGFGGIVKGRLISLKDVVGKQGNALINKSGSKKIKKKGKKVNKAIQNGFKKTIKAY